MSTQVLKEDGLATSSVAKPVELVKIRPSGKTEQEVCVGDNFEAISVLDELDRANRSFGVYRLLSRKLTPLCAKIAAAKGQVRLLDVGCGAGGLLRFLAVELARQGIFTELIGVDVNPVAVNHARTLNGKEREKNKLGARTVSFYRADLNELPEGFCDLFVGSFVLHHLSLESLADWLRQTKRLATAGTVQLDFRDAPALWAQSLWSVALRLGGFSKELRNDGRLSVERAWSAQVLENAARRSVWEPTVENCLLVCHHISGYWGC